MRLVRPIDQEIKIDAGNTETYFLGPPHGNLGEVVRIDGWKGRAWGMCSDVGIYLKNLQLEFQVETAKL